MQPDKWRKHSLHPSQNNNTNYNNDQHHHQQQQEQYNNNSKDYTKGTLTWRTRHGQIYSNSFFSMYFTDMFKFEFEK